MARYFCNAKSLKMVALQIILFLGFATTSFAIYSSWNASCQGIFVTPKA